MSTTVSIGRQRPAQQRTQFDVGRIELAEILAGQPAFRVGQVWQGWYEQFKWTDEISNLPKTTKAQLLEQLPRALVESTERQADNRQTIKWLWALADGYFIETVLMHYAARSTVCISTQAGCAMACSFCATGQQGFDRQLTVGEIIEQYVRAQRRADGRRISNVVFMGMGEPLANFDNTWTAIERLHGDFGLSARHLTVSTVGIIPGILRMATAPLPVNLAVSLHAATDDLRSEIVPINRRYPIDELVEACQDYFGQTGRRVSFEWALIADVNDTAEQAAALARVAKAVGAHVNLIPLNPTPGYAVQGPTPAVVDAFHKRLLSKGVNATVRQNRGTSIDAACGQLRSTVGNATESSS